MMTGILTRTKIFEKILGVMGYIVECGVYRGNATMLYAHLSSIYEPYNFNRKIIGFDTFEGFPSISEKDGEYCVPGLLADTDLEHIQQWCNLHDRNRPIGHIPKIEFIKGDACETIPDYVKKNQHLIIAMLYLDFDAYEPTKIALQYLLPFVTKGGIVVFDELCRKSCKGETIAMHEMIGIDKVKLEKFEFDPHICYYTR
jgi:hypothetical protein